MVKKAAKILFVALVLGFSLFSYAYFIEPNSLIVKDQRIELGCLKQNIPDKFVQISDLHFTDETKKARVDQIYEAIRSQSPAAVFLTGDLVSDESGVEQVIRLTEKISKDYPLFVIFGNWDYWALDYKVGDFKTRLEAAGAKVLVNDAAAIASGGEKINILGVKDPYTSGELKNDIEKAGKNLAEDDKNCRILLAHSPNIINEAVDKNIDLVLAGHTHGGQVYIPFLTKYIVPMKRAAGQGFIKGLYKVSDTQMYVNEGIGISVLPFRFFVPPEVTVLELKKNERTLK